MLDVIRWIIAGLFAALGLFLAGLNWWWFVRDCMGIKSPSMTPLVGGILLVAAVAITPIDGAWRWCWAGLLVDPSWLIFPWAMVVNVRWGYLGQPKK